MPRDAVSRTANVERNGGHKWVKGLYFSSRNATEKYLSFIFRIDDQKRDDEKYFHVYSFTKS